MDNSTLFFALLTNALIAWACSRYAKQRGHNPTLWLFAGFLVGIFALLALLIIPEKKRGKPGPVVAAGKTPPSFCSPHSDKLWYFLDEQSSQLGPMSFDALSRARREGKVQEHTFVWNEAMENWQHFKEVIQPGDILSKHP